MLLGFDEYQEQAAALAAALGMPCRIVKRHRFPDGENKITLPSSLPGHVIFCRSLDHPNEKLLELLLAVNTARELGAKVVTLVAPYLCYMRQDKAFEPGEAVSQRIVGSFLADLFDNLITVDPHLHRIQHLEQVIPTTRTLTLSATALMAEFLAERLQNPVLLGPDSEAEQWVGAVAKPSQWEYGVCEKLRSGDREVEITLPGIDLRDRDVVIVDDVASSGHTLLEAIKGCLAGNARQVDVLVTHALLDADAKQRLALAGARNIWSTDSVAHDSNVIPLRGLLGDAVLSLV